MIPDKQQIARQFSRAASRYDQLSDLQVEMASRLAAWLPQGATGTLLDLGCGTGAALEALDLHGTLQLIGVDLAPGMIREAQTRRISAHWICADLESTPLPDRVADFIFSNAALQWCNLPLAVAEMNRLLAVDGQLLVSTFGPATLHEWRDAWTSQEDPVVPVHTFETADAIHKSLVNSGLQMQAAESKTVIRTFDSIDAILASVKQLGATYAGTDRRPGMLSRRRYENMRQRLQSQFDNQGYLSLTYECLFFHCCKTGSAPPPR